MSNLVFKEQAIDSICVNICGKSHNDCGFWKFNYEMCNACKFARLVESTPSAEKIGKWILIDKPLPDPNGNGIHYKCSVCGSFAPIKYDTPYCPNCGAKMEE